MTRSDPTLRFPDFVIIGAMKSGTTSLYRWLEAQPGVWMPALKEPEFFSRQDRWERGLDWYASLFGDAPEESVVGEASVSYTDPVGAARSAHRMSEVIPDVRLIYLLRHPIERLRSHYRHQVQRGRESRPFGVAVAQPGNEYVARSLYFTCLEPYLDRFSRDALCVVRLEDLVDEDAPGWRSVLSHLGLPARERPREAYNVTEEKVGFTAPALWLYERGLLDRSGILPRWIRRIGKRLLTRSDEGYHRRLSESRDTVPPGVVEAVWADLSRLQEHLGLSRPLWDRDQEKQEL